VGSDADRYEDNRRRIDSDSGRVFVCMMHARYSRGRLIILRVGTLQTLAETYEMGQNRVIPYCAT
jgi:hypothetical protein